MTPEVTPLLKIREALDVDRFTTHLINLCEQWLFFSVLNKVIKYL